MYDHVLVPIAPDHQGRGEASLAAAEVLLNANGRMTLLHVTDPIPAYVESYVPEDIFEKNREATKADLDDLAAKAKHPANVAMVNGHPARAIVDYAERHDADCIVLASHHPGVTDYFLGSTAAWVARHADCSIHVIR
ncbi:MAG: universal stress protein [Pseudomonadota bacterium]